MEPSPDESDIPGVVGRRSARLSIIIPVTVRGTDAAGQAFKENTWTICVNKHGGRIATFHQLADDDQIVIENPLLGRTAKARVKRVCEKRFAEDPYEVCVELLEAQNLWGVKLPPEDWQKERQIVPGDQKSPTPQAPPQAPKTPAPTAERGRVVETAHLAPRGSPADVGEHTGGLSQFNMAVNALSRFAGEANAPPAQPAAHRQDAMGVPEAPAGHPQAPDPLALKALQEKIGEAQSLRQELSLLTDRVQSARVEVENLLLKAREAQRDGTFEAEQVAKKVEEASGKQLQSVLARLDQEVEQRLGSASTRLAGETQQRLQAEAAGIVENIAKEMGDRLSPLAQESLSAAALEFQAQCKGAAEQAKAELDGLVKDATAVVDVHMRKLMEEVSPSLSAQIERSAEQVAREQLEEFKAQIELKAREAQRDGTFEAEQVAKKVEEASGKQLQSVLARLDQEVEQRLGSASTRLAGETQQRLQAEAAGIVENIAKEMGDRLSPLAQESLSAAALEFQAQCKGAAEQAKAELDGLVKDATAVVDVHMRKLMEEVSPSLSAQIDRSAEQVAREQLEEFKAQIEPVRRSSEDSTQRNLERMRQETQAEILNAGIQARKIYKEESGTAAQVISVCVDSAVDSLNRAGDEAVSKLQEAYQTLELSLKKAAEECLPRLADESASVLEKFRAETQALAAQLQSEVESTAREFSEKASGDISEKLEGAVEGALELVARDFNKQAEDALELLKEGLRSAQQQCVDETQRQLAAARESTLTSLESEAGVNLASFRERLHTTLLEMQAQQTKEMEKEIQTSLQGLLESLRTQVHLTADESAARVTAEVRSRAEQALQELPDRLYKGVGMAALVAKEWEEQAKTHLEAHLSHVLEVFQKQLEGLTMAAQERQRSDAEALKGLLQSRLHQAARLFEGVEANASQSKGVAREESRHSPFQSLRASRDPLRPALDPLVEKQQKIIEEALSAFRSRLGRILADHAPKEPQGPAGTP